MDILFVSWDEIKSYVKYSISFTKKESGLTVGIITLEGTNLKKELDVEEGITIEDIKSANSSAKYVIRVNDNDNAIFSILHKSKIYSNFIKNIYIGLPDDFKGKVFWVKEQYRIHPWSFEPGGFDIIVEYYNNKILAYNRIKIPPSYIKKIIKYDLNIDIEGWPHPKKPEQIKVENRAINTNFQTH